MAQRVQSKAKSNKKRRQNQKRRKNAAAASKKLQLDAAATEQKEGKMAAVIRMFSPRSSGNGTGGSMASLFSPNAKKTKKVKVVAEPVEEIPSIEEAPSADTADVRYAIRLGPGPVSVRTDPDEIGAADVSFTVDRGLAEQIANGTIVVPSST